MHDNRQPYKDISRRTLLQGTAALSATVAVSPLMAGRSAAQDNQLTVWGVVSFTEEGDALLGADVTLMPEFTLAPAHAAEFASAYAQGNGGELTEYLRTTTQVIFPVEDWLHGIARVRIASGGHAGDHFVRVTDGIEGTLRFRINDLAEELVGEAKFKIGERIHLRELQPEPALHDRKAVLL